MPKEKTQKHAKGLEAIGKIDQLINLLAKDKTSREWLAEQITMEGPPHKQLQHTLVLSRLQKLVVLKTKTTGIKMSPAQNDPLIVETPHHSVEFPFGFPQGSMNPKYPGLAHALSKGPEHEVAYTAVLLQVIEWLISLEK